MFALTLSEQQKLILEEGLRRERARKLKAFKKRKKTHFNNPKLKAVFENITVEFSQILYELPFQCFFSMYLYLILKSKIKFISWDEMPAGYRIALSMDVNFGQLSKETGVCRNTVRKAYNELVKFKLVEPVDYVKPEHLSTKVCIVFNDFYAHSFDYEAGHVRYSTEIPFNFYNKTFN